ncbi:MAG: radical SAM protein [Candidatus Omnitrophica bacterium]|nr:radical SAM protein [Candidatus Omnitrophota bacterium]
MTPQKIRIALVNPRVESYSSTMPPLGLLYMAAVLEKDGFDVRIFDLSPHHDRDMDALEAFSPDVVGMTVLTDYAVRAKHVSKLIKAKMPRTILFVGGVHVTALPVESLNEFNADYAVIGEGEYVMRDICGHILRGEREKIKDLPGIVWRDQGTVRVNSAHAFIDDLDALPFPARHLLQFENYLMPPGIIRGKWTERSTTVMTSRGCPFSCIWCGGQTTFGRKVRRRSVANVISEIEMLMKTYGVDAVWFVDDTFTLNKTWVMEFCDTLIARNMKLSWGCQAHVKTADEAIFRKMKQAGLVQLDFGVESGSDVVLKNLKKDSTAEEVKRAFALAKKCGIRTCATFIFGAPVETWEDVQKTFDLAKRIKPDFASSYFLTPYPGTELFDLAKANRWTVATDRSGTGLKKKPMLLVRFTEKEIMGIRARFQAQCAFRNFLSLLGNFSYIGKAFSILVRHPSVFGAGCRAFLKSFVIDDFLFAAVDCYVKKRTTPPRF